MFQFKKIKVAFQWSLMRTFVQQFLNPFLRLFIIPLVGPDNYGIVAIAFLYFRFIEIIFPFGIRDFILSRYIDKIEKIKMLHFLSFIFSLVALIISLILSVILFYLYDSYEVSLSLFIISFLFPFIGLGLVPQTIIERKLNIKYLFYISLIPSLTSILVAFPLAFYGYGFWAVLISYILNYTISNIIYFILNYTSFKRPSKIFLAEFFSFGKWNTIEKSSEYFIGWIDLFFISFLGTATAGVYNFGKNFAIILFTMISSPIVNIILPIFSSLKNNPKKLTSFFIDIIGSSILINIFFGFTASFISYYFFQIFLTDWQDLNIVCLYLFVSSIFLRSYTLLREYLKVQNKIKLYPLIIIFSLIIFVSSFLLMNPLTIADFLNLKLFNDIVYAVLFSILLIRIIKVLNSSNLGLMFFVYRILLLFSFNLFMLLISIKFFPFSNNLYYQILLLIFMISINILVLYPTLKLKYLEVRTYYNE